MDGETSIMRARRIRKWVVRPSLALVALASTFVGARVWTNNFDVVQPDRIYRSAQMPPADLARTVRDHRIRTVLNLRGANPDLGWYDAERTTTLDAGATQVDLSMASDMWLSRNQARTVIDV